MSYDEHKEARLELAEARAEIERLRWVESDLAHARSAGAVYRDRAKAAEAQVAAVRALVEEWEVIPLPYMGDHDAARRIARTMGKREAAAALRAALSSPEVRS